jgi:hypothetical protein
LLFARAQFPELLKEVQQFLMLLEQPAMQRKLVPNVNLHECLFLRTDPEVRIRFPARPDFLSSGSGTGSTQPREYN